MIEYERTLVARDRNSTFFNPRTGEVVPAGTDDVAGRVVRNRIGGGYTAYRADGGSQRVATEEAAVHHLVESYRR